MVQTDKHLLPLFMRSFPKGIEYLERGSSVHEDVCNTHISMGSAHQFLRYLLTTSNLRQRAILKKIQFGRLS